MLSEAIHSGFDLLSSLVTFFVVKAAIKPADADHPFGHGKIESLSALFEAFLLLLAGVYVVYESFNHWFGKAHELTNLPLGIAVTLVSIVINFFVYLNNRRVAKEEESIAIETNAFHFLTDIFSSLAVLLGLGLVSLTGQSFWDPLVALFVAVYMGWIGVSQIRKCLHELADTALPPQELSAVERILSDHQKNYLDFHELKTRKAGAQRHVEVHLTVCSEQKVHEAHAVCDRIEEDLAKRFKDIQTSIHMEPCGNHAQECSSVCLFYDKPRSALK